MKPQDRFTDVRHAKAFRDLDHAVALERNGMLVQADSAYATVIANNPQYFDALHLYGLFKFKRGQLSDAIRLIENAHKLNPGSLNALNSLGVVYAHLKSYGQALDTFNKIVQHDQNNIQALSNKAQCLNELGRFQEAVDICDKILSLDKFKLDASLARGAALLELGNHEQALLSYQNIVAFNPTHAVAWCGIGNAFYRLKRYDEALAAYDRALFLKADLENAWFGRGNALSDLRRHNEALVAYDKAVSIKPNLTEAWLARAVIFSSMRRSKEAIDAYTKVKNINPDFPFIDGFYIHQKMLSCDWAGLDRMIQAVEADIFARKPSALPFGWQGLSESEQSLRLCAQIWNEIKFPIPKIIRKDTIQRTKLLSDKIRIGYVSGEFRDHATSRLIAGLLESHDKAKFEVIGLDNGWDDSSAVRARINNALNKIIDIRRLDDDTVAAKIHDERIDILVNLNGYFGEGRTRVFAYKAAPIQVNYLGFPGTLGAGYIDYIIADKCVLPPESKICYDEKVVYLPHTYQVNDRNKTVSESNNSRSESNLPLDEFVFCCFNNAYKITPNTFDSWMAILKRVDNSVLWLLEDNDLAAQNLRREAQQRAVDPSRLIFAKRMPLADHLARHLLADLFLDTLPYNAHTTASDALWAGLPVLTQIGQTFAGRVAASLLNAIGLPELITHSRQEYEALAVELALNRERLFLIREKLEKNRMTTPLFDTALFTRHMEAAYEAMYQRNQAGLLPDHIEIQPITTS
jgi:predicted O-linked N-acetylglucosamine transferase (SPINDLY family)